MAMRDIEEMLGKIRGKSSDIINGCRYVYCRECEKELSNIRLKECPYCRSKDIEKVVISVVY